MPSPDDVKRTHRLEQASGSLREAAKIVFDYYSALVEQGFTKEQAMALTVVFQGLFFEQSFNGRAKGPGA